MENKLKMLSIILVPIYLIGTMVIGFFTNADPAKISLTKFYNWWILVGALSLSVLLVGFMWKRNVTNLDSFLGVILIPIIFFVLLYLVSSIFPDSYKINNIGTGTSVHNVRYQVSDVILKVALYTVIINFIISIFRGLFNYLQKT